MALKFKFKSKDEVLRKAHFLCYVVPVASPEMPGSEVRVSCRSLASAPAGPENDVL